MNRDEVRYLEDLARQIEAAARVTPNRAKLMKIADNVRRYKDKRDQNLIPADEEFEFIEA